MIRDKQNAKQKPKNLFKFATQSLTSAKFQAGTFTRKQHTPQHILSNKHKNKLQSYEDNLIHIQMPHSSSHQISKQINQISSISSHHQQQNKNKLIIEVDRKIKSIQQTMTKAMELISKKQNDKIQRIRNQNNDCLQQLVSKVNKRFLRQDKSIQGVKQDIDLQRNNLILLKKYIQQQGITCLQKKSNNYSINLKNSVQELEILQMNNQNQQIQELRKQIQNMKNIINNYDNRFSDLASIKRQLSENQRFSQKNINHQYVNDKINLLIKQIQVNNRVLQNRLNEQNCTIRITINLLEENISTINEQFKRVINFEVIPKIHKIQNQISQDTIMKNLKKYYQDTILQQSKKIHTVKIRELTVNQKDKLKHLSGQISYKQTYLLDQQNYLLDSQGIYLVDENKNRIKITQDQIYFLQIQGIEIIQTS